MTLDIIDSSSSLPLASTTRSKPVANVYIFESNAISSSRKRRRSGEAGMQVPIYPNDAFYLGRDSGLCRGKICDSSVSYRHIKIHCIQFENEMSAKSLPPLIYVEDLSSRNGTFLVINKDQERVLRARKGPYLISSGDKIRLGLHTTCIFTFCGSSMTPISLNDSQKLESKYFENRYIITERSVGFGTGGNVFIAIHQRSQKLLACKVTDISQYRHRNPQFHVPESQDGSLSSSQDRSKGLEQRLRKFREIQILKNLDHPNIVQVEKAFVSSQNIYVFQELYPGGDLYSYWQFKRCKLPNIEAASILFQVLKGVAYLHSHNIVHRDLKMDNVLMTTFSAQCRVVLCDFGCAVQLTQDPRNRSICISRMFSVTGTFEYMAPEVLKMNSKVNPDAGYSKAIDMWSIGIMTSYLLSGRNPIDPEISYTSDHKVSRKPGEFGPGTYFERFVALAVGNHAANLIRKLCEPDELRRLTAKRALEHSWFHSDRIETLYQIATADWKGRGVSIKPIEEVNFNDAHMMLKSVSVVPRDSSEYCPDSRQVPTRKAELATEATKTLVSNNRIILSQDTPILDSIRNEDQNFQDMISQDIYDVSTSHNINKLSTSRPNGSYNWDIPRSESETDSIESSRSDHAIRRPGKLPMKSCKTNPSLLFHTSIQKSKRMKHAFKRQRKEDASPLPLNLLIGDGFENP